MSIFQTILLSIVEGLTEYLPISSTGHLILASDFLKVGQTPFVKTFEIFIQLGAILAIVVLYFKTITTNFKLWPKIIAAFIPTGIIGLILYKLIRTYLLGNTLVTLLALLIGGIALIILEKYYHEKIGATSALSDITYKDAVILGIFQSLAIIPGVSRSAATICGGLLRGLKRTTAVEFSFLLAIPTMVAAAVLDIYESQAAFSKQEYLILGLGFLGSFVTAILAVKFLVSYVKGHDFVMFGVYRIVLSVIFAVFILSR